ncbi:MAG: apolipoprotein N-acyltransferase [Polyangiaceae bacterium]|nr:apolipoprotein N-acyltransferase [Polyangiaceae bacterium]
MLRPLPAGPAYGLAALSGLLYFLGFPGVDIWPLSFIALAPLIVAMRRQTPRRAAGLGWTAGFVMTMTGFYWLLEMLRVFSGFPIPLCALFMVLLCGYQGGRIALCGWLTGRAEARGWPASVAFALAFVASELVFPLLFPWYFGSSVHNAPLMMQVADLGGPYLVGLVLVAANLAIAELAQARLDARPLDRRLVAIGAAAPALAAIYGAIRIHQVDGRARVAEAVKLGIVQPNLALFDRKNATKIHLDRTRELRDKGADLVIWSEAGVPRAFREQGYEASVQRDLTRHLGVPTVIGTVLHGAAKKKGERGMSYNTALMAGEGGEILGRYDKRYLLAFGEYIPFGETFPQLYDISQNSGRFSRGTSLDPLRWKDHRMSVMICYEDILPDYVNKLVAAGDPDLLVNMTNDAWFGDSTEPWIHLALAKMRAVEHRRYLVRATNSGVSAIVDPVGRVILRGGTFREESLLGEVRFMRATTLYGLIQDYPWYLVTLAIAAMAWRSRPRSGPLA